MEPDCEDNENITFKNFPSQCASNAKLVDSHFFTLGLHVGKTQALLQTLVATDEQVIISFILIIIYIFFSSEKSR